MRHEEPDHRLAKATDEELFRRFREGDERALQELFARHGASLRAWVARRLPRHLRRRVSVSDVVQEARLGALDGGSAFQDRGPGSFRRWLFGIAENKAKEAVRNHAAARRATGREISRAYRPDSARFEANGPSPSEAAVAEELAARIRAALLALPEDYREVLRLTRGEGLTLREAAQRMGRSREAVKKLYGRAFCRFKEAFAGGGRGADG